MLRTPCSIRPWRQSIEKVEKLEACLRQPDTGRGAFELICGLIDAVILTPMDGKLEIELRGDLAGILAISGASKDTLGNALQIKVRGPAATYTEHASDMRDSEIGPNPGPSTTEN